MINFELPNGRHYKQAIFVETVVPLVGVVDKASASLPHP